MIGFNEPYSVCLCVCVRIEGRVGRICAHSFGGWENMVSLSDSSAACAETSHERKRLDMFTVNSQPLENQWGNGHVNLYDCQTACVFAYMYVCCLWSASCICLYLNCSRSHKFSFVLRWTYSLDIPNWQINNRSISTEKHISKKQLPFIFSETPTSFAYASCSELKLLRYNKCLNKTIMEGQTWTTGVYTKRWNTSFTLITHYDYYR